MEVAYVRAEVEVVAMTGGEKHCLWQPMWDESVKLPVPPELSVVRGATFPGFTCTSIGSTPELCATCPARGACPT